MAQRFDVYEVSLELVVAMRLVVERVKQHDRDLAAQLKRATSSVPANIAEGQRRVGRDRIHLWRIAEASANEVRCEIEVAVAWGELDPAIAEPARHLLDRILAMLWRLTHVSPAAATRTPATP